MEPVTFTFMATVVAVILSVGIASAIGYRVAVRIDKKHQANL